MIIIWKNGHHLLGIHNTFFLRYIFKGKLYRFKYIDSELDKGVHLLKKAFLEKVNWVCLNFLLYGNEMTMLWINTTANNTNLQRKRFLDWMEEFNTRICINMSAFDKENIFRIELKPYLGVISCKNWHLLMQNCHTIRKGFVNKEFVCAIPYVPWVFSFVSSAFNWKLDGGYDFFTLWIAAWTKIDLFWDECVFVFNQ